MKRKAAVFAIFLLTLSGLQAWAQSETLNYTPAVESAPAAELDLFTPKFEYRGCYLDCTRQCVADMCSGIPPEFLQQCSNDCAEGCRCNCGLWCP